MRESPPLCGRGGAGCGRIKAVRYEKSSRTRRPRAFNDTYEYKHEYDCFFDILKCGKEFLLQSGEACVGKRVYERAVRV